MYPGVDASFRLCHTSLIAKGVEGEKVLSVSREDIVQSSADSSLKMVCLKLSSPRTNTPMD